MGFTLMRTLRTIRYDITHATNGVDLHCDQSVAYNVPSNNCSIIHGYLTRIFRVDTHFKETSGQTASGQAMLQAKRMRLHHIGRSLVSQNLDWNCVREEQPSGAQGLALALGRLWRSTSWRGQPVSGSDTHGERVATKVGEEPLASLRCNWGRTNCNISISLCSAWQ